MPLEPGREFSHYRVVEKLGEGGMGEVYRALDLALDRTVAIKLLPREAAGDPAVAERFLREARAASALNHPHIVTVYAVEQADGVHFIAMELVEGETLRDRLLRGHVPLPELLEIGLMAADALDAAHAARLIHRDIKPSNILLTPRGQVKLLDFGLAKRFAPAADVPTDATRSSELTTPGTIVGTVAYMSPEQSRGERLDPRSDVFSLGSVLYEAATGRPAFTGPSTIALLHEIVTRDPDPPSAIRPGLPYSFDLLIARALAKDRERRFASATELAEALRALRSELSGAVPTAPREAAAAGPNNLPAEAKSFVGRAREVAEVKRLIAANRLVTVTGSGGCGKTRLALRVAGDLVAEFPDGVWLTELAGLSDPTLVPQAVATALGLREEAERPIAEALAAHATSRRLLLLLDNCEHLAAACSALADSLLHAAPGVRILATSREPLGVSGEARWVIPPLTLPAAGEPVPATPDRALQYEAVRLFVERARAAQASFAFTDTNAAAVTEICCELDGIPLAVELAAARVNVLPVAQILARLRDRFRLLTGGSRTAAARQQTLRAAVDWSYELLSPAERTLFNRLSVFAGGLTLEAAEAVCTGGSIEESHVLDLLAHLADKSLIVPEEGAAGTARYRLLETLREYGRERLHASGEEPNLLERHRDYFASLAEAGRRELAGPRQTQWVTLLEEMHGNLRAALQNAIDRGDAVRALRLGSAFWQFWWIRGYWREGRRWLEAVLALESPDDASTHRVVALRGAGVITSGLGDFAAAEEYLGRSIDLARKIGFQIGLAAALREMGSIANDKGDWEAERRYYEESLVIFREVGDEHSASLTLHNLAGYWQGEGDLEKARALYQEAHSITHRLGDHIMEAWTLSCMGTVASDQGDIEGARSLQEQALVLHRETGQRPGVAFSLGVLGVLEAQLGNLAEAQVLLCESLDTFVDVGAPYDIACALDRSARVATIEGAWICAMSLYGAADSMRGVAGLRRQPCDERVAQRALREARAALGEAAADRSYASGRALTVEQAVELARQRDAG